MAPEGERIEITSLTPSGIEVLYSPRPKRLYEVRKHGVETPDGYETVTPWVEVQSVTTVLDVLPAPGLPWWGMEMGVSGMLELAERGLLREVDGKLMVPGRGLTGATLVPASLEEIVGGKKYGVGPGLLTEFKLTVNHKRDKAGDRGQSVHDAFEAYCMRGVVPHPEIYPAHERGYVEGLRAFLMDLDRGGPTDIDAEVMVGSIEHEFAGRYDLTLATTKSCELVTKIYDKRAPKIETFEPGLRLWDLKTSSGVHDKHQIQLETYEAARVECGYAPTEERIVVRVTPDGRYEAVKSKARFSDFLAAKALYEALDSLKRRRK